MKNSKFKIGDNVRLKTGEKTMVVSSIKTDLYGEPIGRVFCRWSDGKKQQKDLFHEDTLDLVL